MKEFSEEELDSSLGQVYIYFVPAIYASGYCILNAGYIRIEGKQVVRFQNYEHTLEIETTYGLELFDVQCKILGWSRKGR